MKQQVSRLERSEKADLYKIKKHKDLAFMFEIKADQISENITKYLLKEGSGPQINEIKVPISLHYSYEKYDYTGKLIIRVQNKTLQIPYSLKQNEVEESNISSCLLSMRTMQKSWFNIELSNRSSTNCSGYHGYHYEIILDKFQYKNDNTYESKKLIYEDNRQKGKQLFLANNFKEAIKIYRHSINILSGLSKKFFTQDQKRQLEGFRQKSEANFLKCLAKLNGFGGRHDKEISKLAFEISERFMKKYPQSPNSFYQKAIILKYQSKFGDAEEAINEGLNKKFSEDEQEAAKQRNTLKNMKEQIKKAKQRNIRHLHREEIRKRKNERRNKNVWSKENDTWSSSEDDA